MRLLRVGRISALNMYPIYHGLERAADPTLSFTDGVPTTLNAALLEGRLDVSAVSSIAYARNAERLRLVPVASITADGAVDSIRLFSRVPFDEVRTVAVTPHSATSVALLRVLIGADAAPFEVLTEDPRVALGRVDGVLLIGDEALEGSRAPFAPHRTDLGAVWRERTGHPMVFAVWAASATAARERPEALAELSALLAHARTAYLADPEAVVQAAAERFPFPAAFIRPYLRRLRYDFGDAERAGLEEFLRRATASGELDAVPRLAA
ncbi:menaquinone biosynthetic enzyme MqnA/MqnD family protein [Miltoncostaea oceani]|uniref:menaquinone biosynthetic enzyme MqnA/MqnD family protein n=1 Tax=Miltoncostaea oceani TaxID=2843216 RepID=UPI001C3D33E4|nr:menaquinone biosynthesis protein [Miltoncostaea oceani]